MQKFHKMPGSSKLLFSNNNSLLNDFDKAVDGLCDRDIDVLRNIGIGVELIGKLESFFQMLRCDGFMREWVLLFSQHHYHTIENIECPFHMESLLEHLLRVSLLTSNAAHLLGKSDEYIIQTAICGFLHDAGKVYAGFANKRGNQYVAYPCHCNYGAFVIRTWLCGKTFVPDVFTKQFVENMCVVVNCHMCGTHSGTNNDDELFRASHCILCHLTDEQRELLSIIRIGDTCGSVPDEIHQHPDFDEMFAVREEWLSRIVPSTLFSRKKGVIIYLYGFVVNGKSTVGRLLAERFGGVLCTRDDIIAKIGLVFKPYDSNPYSVFQQIRGITITVEKAIQVISKLRLADVVKLPLKNGNLSVPNEKGNPMSVNQFADWICRQWGDYVLSNNGVFILDTVGLIVGNNNTCPPNACNAMKFGLYCKSTVPLTDADINSPNRSGIPELKNVARTETLANPIGTPSSWINPKFGDGQLSSLGLRKMITVSSRMEDLTNKDRNKTNPHYAHHAIWDGSNIHGYEHFVHMVKAMSNIAH